MKKLFTVITVFLLSFSASRAQVFYTETFDGTPCPASSGCDPSLVSWTLSVVGAEGTTPNLFYVSCQENGNAAGACGSGCGSDQSLHIGNMAGSPASIICPGGDCGAAYDASAGCETDKRAESPTINCSAYSNITIDFVYMEQGEGANDDASLWYFDGATWSMLDPLAKTPLGACAPQGTWTAFTTNLPASADGNPNVRIGFRWVNNGNNSGSDPSFAVDDITLSSITTSPTAGFTFLPAAPCTGSTVTFTNTSSGGTAPLSYQWTFTGGTPGTSTATNPTCTFATAGPHNVQLIVTDAAGQDDTITQVVNVVSCASPVASFTFLPSPACMGAPVTFTNSSGGGTAPLTYQWTFPSGTPATSTTTNPIVTWAAAGTYNIQLITTDATGADDTTVIPITVVNCATPPTAGFNISANPICFNDCINFTNTSTGAGTLTYAWTFAGASTPTSTATNPTGICYPTVGTFNVTLIVTNAGGSDTLTQTVTVNNCTTPPVANFTAQDTICRGQCINFSDASTGTPTSWTWTFAGGTPGSSTLQNPGSVCFNTVGTFLVTLSVTNAGGTSSHTETIVVVNCSPPTANFGVSDNQICMQDCITITNSTLNATSYQWTFTGGTPPTSTSASPGTVCYNDTTGVFQITLIAFNQYGSDTLIQNIVVDTVPIVEAFPDEVGISLGNTIDLYAVANGTVDYAWVTTDTASIGDTTSQTVSVTPTAPGTVIYYVIVTGANGCSNTDSVIVNVELTDVIGLPNAFSPNNDGHNDILSVLGPGVQSMHLVIYNRYGQLVFESTDQNKGWDGKHNNKNVDPGVFAYYLEYTLVNGLTGLKKGNITLIR